MIDKWRYVIEHRLCAVALLVVSSVATSTARAGEQTYLGVAAVSEDASYSAVFMVSEGSGQGNCGLIRGVPGLNRFLLEPFLVEASCGAYWGRIPPLKAWTWATQPKELKSLRAFADPWSDSTGKDKTRLVFSQDTRLSHLELLKDGKFWPVHEVEDPVPKVTGLIVSSGNWLVRLRREESINYWDDVVAIASSEIPDVLGRASRSRAAAASATEALRSEREQQTGVFAGGKPGRKLEAARERRRRAALEKVARAWEVAAIYHSLVPSDLRQALWVLALLDTPVRRLEALRWWQGLRDRDSRAATALIEELRGEPVTRSLADYLANGKDYLRGLPDVSREVVNDEALTNLTDQELSWVHRQFRAVYGQFHFSDPEVEAYFSQFPWYSPIPPFRWRQALADKFFVKDPDGFLLRQERWVPSGESLKAILRAEKKRGLVAPPL